LGYYRLVKRAHIIVTGRVQGVSFRAYAQLTARALGLTGWVRNMPSGQVEIVAEGTEDRLEQLIAWARTGPSLARVDDLRVTYEPPAGDFTDFTVK
jgi:acylphosphatase